MSGPVLLEVRRGVEASGCTVVDVLAHPDPHSRAPDRTRHPVARVEVRYPGGERGVVEVTSIGSLVVLGPPAGPRYVVAGLAARGGSRAVWRERDEVLALVLAEPYGEHRSLASNATFRELLRARNRLRGHELGAASVECARRRLDEEGALALDPFVEEETAASATRLLDALASGAPFEWALRRSLP